MKKYALLICALISTFNISLNAITFRDFIKNVTTLGIAAHLLYNTPHTWPSLKKAWKYSSKIKEHSEARESFFTNAEEILEKPDDFVKKDTAKRLKKYNHITYQNSQSGQSADKLFTEKIEKNEQKYNDACRPLRNNLAWALLIGYRKSRLCGVAAGILWTQRLCDDSCEFYCNLKPSNNSSEIIKNFFLFLGYPVLGIASVVFTAYNVETILRGQ